MGEPQSHAPPPTASEFSEWMKEMRATSAPEEAARVARNKKHWDDMASDNELPAAPPEAPPQDDRAAPV
jgi:hypothetical protein